MKTLPLAEFRDWLTDLAARDEFAGAVLLQRRDETLFGEAFGYAIRPWRVPNTLTTRFRIASIAKMFTAVSVLQLIEAGRFGLATSVVPYLGLTSTRIPAEVTVQHLLTHTSGIADYFDESVADAAAAWDQLWADRPLHRLRTTPDYLPLFVDREPVTAPGAAFRYNGAGFILLGLLIAKASGQSDFDYVREHIFVPAGMDRSGFVATDDVVPETADGYERVSTADGNTVWRRNVNTVTPQAAADGGATSTVGDLVRFMQALRRGELIAPRLTELMFSPHALVSRAAATGGADLWYGLGSFVSVDGDGRTVRGGHTGEETGVSGRLFHYPNSDITLAVLANQGGCAGQVVRRLNELLLD